MRSFPPLEFAFGVMPIQAAKSRPVRKVAGSWIAARTVAAMIGPTPGMVVSRRAASSAFTAATIFVSSASNSGGQLFDLLGHFQKRGPGRVRQTTVSFVAQNGNGACQCYA